MPGVGSFGIVMDAPPPFFLAFRCWMSFGMLGHASVFYFSEFRVKPHADISVFKKACVSCSHAFTVVCGLQ